MKKVLFLLVALATIICATNTVNAKKASRKASSATSKNIVIPTFSQVNDVFYGEKSALRQLGITCLRKNLHKHADGEITGSIYYGQNAKVTKNGNITPTSSHAIVIEACQGMEVSNITIYFSNKDDFDNYYNNTAPEGGWSECSTGERDGLYYVYYDDQGE